MTGRDVDRRARRRLEKPAAAEDVELPTPRVTSRKAVPHDPVPGQLDLLVELAPPTRP